MKRYLPIKRYFAALNHYKWYAAGCFAVTLATVAGATTLLPENKTTYVAQGTLLYQPATEAASGKNQSSAAQNSIASTEMLTSDKFLQLTAETLQTKRQAIAPDDLRGQIKLEKDAKQENQFLIQYQDSDAQQAKLVVESFIQAVSSQSLTDKRKEVEASVQLLEKRKGVLEDNLRVAEEKLREFSRQEKPAIQAAVDGSLVSAITNIQQQQRQLRRELEGIDAELLSIQNKLGMTPERAYIASALSADPTIAALKTKIDEFESQLAIQRQELQPKHPDIVALRHQQRVYETQLQQRIREIVGGNGRALVQDVAQFRQLSSLDKTRQELANKLVNLQTQRNRSTEELAILSRSEPELKQNYSDGTALKLELEKLTKDVARYREALDQTQKQLATAELKKVEARSDWVSDDLPHVRDLSNWWLSRPILWAGGAGLGLLIAGTAVLVLDILRGKILIPEEVQAILQQRVPFLGVLPAIPKQVSKQEFPVLLEADSLYLESYELLRSSLHRHNHDHPLKAIVLSSTRDDEGKTISAYNLAIASARAGKKTLLIEANLRTASQVHALGMTPALNQASDCFVDCLQIENMQAVPDVKNLFVLPSLGCIEQVTEILESNQVQQLLKQARSDFDFVVIDAAALRFSDALLLEPLTDGLVLVTRPGYTDRSGLSIVIEKLTEFSDIRLLGAVMNHVTTSANSAHWLSL